MSHDTIYPIRKYVFRLVVVEIILWLLLLTFWFFIMPSVTGLVVQRPLFLWANVGLTILSVLFILLYHWKNKKLLKFSTSSVFQKIVPSFSTIVPINKYILWRIAMFFLVIALINPRFGSKELDAKIEGIDLIIALDVSNSMMAEDIQPNRLTRAKMAIEQLINKLHGDRVGLVIFAGEAYVQLPITSDYSAAKIFLDVVDTDIIPVQGTAIGQAIELSASSFEKNSTSGKAIIVVTDGENHEDDALEAATAAMEEGIKVYTIGMGSLNGSPIPIVRRGKKIGFKKDKKGNTVVSKLNADALREIADAGDGKFTRATMSNVGLDSILEDINNLDKNEFETRQYEDYEDRFQIFLLVCVLLLIIYNILPDKKLNLSNKTKLFD